MDDVANHWGAMAMNDVVPIMRKICKGLGYLINSGFTNIGIRVWIRGLGVYYLSSFPPAAAAVCHHSHTSRTRLALALALFALCLVISTPQEQVCVSPVILSANSRSLLERYHSLSKRSCSCCRLVSLLHWCLHCLAGVFTT